jgi:hypothetical protein
MSWTQGKSVFLFELMCSWCPAIRSSAMNLV